MITYEEYFPYGQSAYRARKSGVEVSARRYRYTGKERDDETGLYLMGARYYAAWLARWTAADPAGTVDGTNLYAYVRGSPVGLVDPSGTKAQNDPVRPWNNPPPKPEKVAEIQDLIDKAEQKDKTTRKWRNEAGKLKNDADQKLDESVALTRQAQQTKDKEKAAGLRDRAERLFKQNLALRKSASSKERRAAIVEQQANTVRQEAIDKAAKIYRIDISAANTLTYDPVLDHHGKATEARDLTIGKTAFESPGRLAATIAHEAEGHAKQVEAGFSLGTAVDIRNPDAKAETDEQIQNTLQEIKAYDWVIGNAKRFGLSAAEAQGEAKWRTRYFNLLPKKYQDRVNRGNMNR